jgi:hypothetical protein
MSLLPAPTSKQFARLWDHSSFVAALSRKLIDKIQRKSHPHFKPGEMVWRCRTAMRESGRSVYVQEIKAALMKAEKLHHSDLALPREIGKQVRNALFYMERRGTVINVRSHRAARWESVLIHEHALS